MAIAADDKPRSLADGVVESDSYCDEVDHDDSYDSHFYFDWDQRCSDE